MSDKLFYMVNFDKNNLIHTLDSESTAEKISYHKLLIFIFATIIFGVIVGFITARFPTLVKKETTSTSSMPSSSKKTVGIADKKTFKDKAEGVLKEGGIDGEGNFHLERPGGASQNVYLTSSTVDLSQFIGKKVRVWGQTFKGEKAGWLMDVGLVEILQ